MIVIQCILSVQAALGQFEPLEELEPLELAPLEVSEPFARPAAPRIEPTFAPGMRLYVDATSLALRTGPKIDAGLIHYIPADDMVTALEDVIDPVPLEIGKKKGLWIYVQHGQHKGYVFDAYLMEVPPSLDKALDWKCEPGKRVGPITSKTTYEDLALIVGEGNLALAQIPIGEGDLEEGTAVFPGDKLKELIIRWEIPHVRPRAVIVNGSQWKTTSGLGIGVRLSKVVEVNQAPVSFAGFGWDYAGYVRSWRAGQLEKTHQLRTAFLVYLAPERPYLPADFASLQGDQEFSSEMPEAEGVNLKISSMTIVFSE